MLGGLEMAEYICCNTPALGSTADLSRLRTEPALNIPIQGMINPPGFG